MSQSPNSPSSTPEISAGLLIGAGSIGQRHFDCLAERFKCITVVDPKKEAIGRLRIRGRIDFCDHSTIEDALEHTDAAEAVLAVVANWGPDHLSTVQTLVDAGVSRILVEKPLATSPRDCQVLVDLARDRNVRLMVGMHRKFTPLASMITAAATSALQSDVTGVVVHGGALDISTTGVHWLDLVCDVFQEEPCTVAGLGRSHPINPRSQTLEFWEGTVAWYFPSGRRLSMVFDNASSVSGTALFYAREGIIEVAASGLRIHAQESESLDIDEPITRHRPATMQWEISYPDGMLTEGRTRLYDLLASSQDIDTYLESAARTTSNVLAGLWSVDQHQSLELPVATSHASYSYARGVS